MHRARLPQPFSWGVWALLFGTLVFAAIFYVVFDGSEVDDWKGENISLLYKLFSAFHYSISGFSGTLYLAPVRERAERSLLASSSPVPMCLGNCRRSVADLPPPPPSLLSAVWRRKAGRVWDSAQPTVCINAHARLVT